MPLKFESLPVELIADVLSELDLNTLVTVSYLSRRLHQIASDPSLNPWRRPILRNLRSGKYEACFRTLSVRSTVPRQNWLEILSIARSDFVLFEATIPNLSESDWEECFKKRFLPGWVRWQKEGRWKALFMKALFRILHRTLTSCTADEAWTKYVVINRNGSANLLESASRTFNPLAIFNELKLQNNLAHLETHVRLLVQFADVRVLAFGVLNRPRSAWSINENARALLHPPGITAEYLDLQTIDTRTATLPRSYPKRGTSVIDASRHNAYMRLTRPLPTLSHANYPFYTPGGGDKRWIGSGELEEEGRSWVGIMMLTAQLVTPQTSIPSEGPALQDMDLVVGPGRNQYASFAWEDLFAIAPWMEGMLTRKVDGPGLGL